MQTRLQSMIEAVANVLVGYLVAVGSQMVLFPLFDIHIPVHQNFILGGYFTVISLIRSYVLRRYFNGLKFKESNAIQ